MTSAASTLKKPTITQSKAQKTSKPKPVSTQWRDPFIEELHETRRKLLAKAGNNMHQLILNAQQTAVIHGFVAGV